MKTISFLLLALCSSLLSTPLAAQTPEGYVQGSITLANGGTQNGLVKDNMAKKGSITFMENSNAKKVNYDGIALSTVTLNNASFICIKGDFFKVISNGKVALLQKASKTSTQVLYSGSDPVGVAGTDGKQGDYYLYKSNILTLLTKKNVATELTNHTNDCSIVIGAYDKENLASLESTITQYNNCK